MNLVNYLARTPNGRQHVRAALLQEHGAIGTGHHDSGKTCEANFFSATTVKTKTCTSKYRVSANKDATKSWRAGEHAFTSNVNKFQA